MGATLVTIAGRQFADPDLRERIESVFSTASVIRDHEVRLRSHDGSDRACARWNQPDPRVTEKPLALLSLEPNGLPLSRPSHDSAQARGNVEGGAHPGAHEAPDRVSSDCGARRGGRSRAPHPRSQRPSGALEIQNRELRETQERLEETSSRYSELYDFAPVGYCTLDPKGNIQEINLTGAALLGTQREMLS